MLKLSTILAPTDFSERSMLSAQHAVHMARHFGSKLILAHVTEIPDPYYRLLLAPERADIEQRCREEMARMEARLRIDMPIETVLREGDAAGRIEDIIRERKVDLVMMATHGRGLFRRFVMGSVTAKVLHDVQCPVFTGVHIPHTAKFTGDPYVRVACAVDLRCQSDKVLRWAAGFASSWKAELILIHAVRVVSTDEIYSSSISSALAEGLVLQAKEKLERLCHAAGCNPEMHVAGADAVPYVTDVAAKTYADVLIIGRSVNGLTHGRLRSHAYAMIRESPCPVISV
jgi:nucleotide-binding universal stress UspA family protein